jgi:hypothetical protein
MSRKPKSRSKKTKTAKITNQEEINPTRRKLIRLARNSAIGIAVVGATGGYLTYSTRATMHEQDLTRVGQGRPSVVQIHDPQCPVCQRLQRATRAALSRFDDGELDYVVANIRSGKGDAFANKYAVPHVTLLLFDADGELQHILRGEQQADALEREFKKLIRS